MNKAMRQSLIIGELQADYPASLTASQLASRFDVSARTIERDLAELLAAGAAVSPARGRRGGYRFGDNGTILIVFSREEASALVAFFSNPKVTPFYPATRKAIAKLNCAL